MHKPLAMMALAMAALPALSAAAPQPAASPFLGQWKLDTGSAAAGDAGPASVTAEFTDTGAGVWNTTYVITARDGSARRMTSRERLDGTPVAITGDQSIADSAAMTAPQPGVLVLALFKGGTLQSTRVYTLSPDGSEMTESAAVVGDDGKPAVLRFRWVR